MSATAILSEAAATMRVGACNNLDLPYRGKSRRSGVCRRNVTSHYAPAVLFGGDGCFLSINGSIKPAFGGGSSSSSRSDDVRSSGVLEGISAAGGPAIAESTDSSRTPTWLLESAGVLGALSLRAEDSPRSLNKLGRCTQMQGPVSVGYVAHDGSDNHHIEPRSKHVPSSSSLSPSSPPYVPINADSMQRHHCSPPPPPHVPAQQQRGFSPPYAPAAYSPASSLSTSPTPPPSYAMLNHHRPSSAPEFLPLHSHHQQQQRQHQQQLMHECRRLWPAQGVAVPVPIPAPIMSRDRALFCSSPPSPSPPSTPPLSPPSSPAQEAPNHFHSPYHSPSQQNHHLQYRPPGPPLVFVPSPDHQQEPSAVNWRPYPHQAQRDDSSLPLGGAGTFCQQPRSSPPVGPPQQVPLQLLGPDFGRRRSTRVVSKQHFGRQNSNLGRHSQNADEAAQELARAGRSEILIVRALDQWGDKMNGLEDFSYLLRFLGNRTQSASATLCAFDWMVSHEGIKKDRCKLASTMISILGRLGRVDMAAEVFERMQEVGREDSVYTYTALLSAYGRSGMYKEALDLFQSMRDQGLKPNLVTYNTVIDACGKGGAGLKKALELFHQMRHESINPDRITYNSLIAVCSRGGHWQEAHEVFQEMKRKGIEQDNFTFNTLIDALCKAGQMGFAAEVMGVMVAPNVVTYSTMIDGYGKLGQSAEAIHLFQKMTTSGILPDRITYNTLLDIHGKAGNFEHALAVFREMEALGFRTDTVTYNALIDAYGKQGLHRDASRLFDEMQARGLRPNVLTYSALIGAFAKVGMHEEAVMRFGEMKQMGLKPDVVLYSTLVDVYGKSGLVEEATSLIKEMIMAGIEPNVVTFNSLIDAYGRRGQVDRALQTLEQTCGSSGFVVADASTCSRVIDAYSHDGRKDDALALLSRMQVAGIGVPPEYIALSTLMDDVSEHGVDVMAAVQVFQEMQEAGVKPNVVTFSALLSVCSRFSTWQEASRLLDGVRKCEPLVYGVAHGLLKGDNGGVWGQAGRLFDQIGTTDSDTRKAFYNALVDVLWRFGQKQGAQRVILEAQRRQVFGDACTKAKERAAGTLDLHLMSVGTAQAMLYVWLNALRLDVLTGLDLPRQLNILTGWGKHSKMTGDSIVKREVEAVLEGMESPFKVAGYNEGRIIACGQDVQEWLVTPRVERMLELVDERVPVTRFSYP